MLQMTNERSPMAILMVALLVVAAIWATLGIASMQMDWGSVSLGNGHSLIKHGGEAEMARKCVDGRQYYSFWNPASKRWGIVCQVEDKWGVLILDEQMREITAFLKNKMKDFDQVVQYMSNAGYLLPK
jgi:hypothetical protein